MERFLQTFIEKFSSDTDLINPFVMSLKMIISSSNIESVSQENSLQEPFSFMKDYLCCNNVCILDDSGNIIFSYYALNDSLLSVITRKIKASRNSELNVDFEFSIDSKKSHRINLFSLDSLYNRYYIVFIDNDLEKGAYTDDAVAVVKATLLVIISNIEKLQRIKDLSERDGLTWVKNRQIFQRDLLNIPNLDAVITFILIDLYQLRNINNKFGHLAGDSYIKTSAKLLGQFFSDSVYRIGGDEFAIITTADFDVDKTMTEINKALEECMKDFPEKCYLNYGFVKEHSKAVSPEEFYSMADKNESQNKRAWYTSLGINRRG